MFKEGAELVTGDANNDRKFIFIAQDNKVDYRPKSASPLTNGHAANPHQQHNGHATNGTPTKKFPWSQEPRKIDTMTVDVVQAKNFPMATYVTLNSDNKDENGRGDSNEIDVIVCFVICGTNWLIVCMFNFRLRSITRSCNGSSTRSIV